MSDHFDKHPLAVIIPAYKPNFLAKALAGLVRQTDQRFNIYVCDDASPADIRRVAQTTLGARPYVYQRFENNLGGESLTRHWNRCVAVSNEPWVWLFSDDDVMEPECVAAFYRTLETTGGAFDVYRFDTLCIDENDQPLRLNPPHPEQESWLAFAYFLLSAKRASTAQEVIVRRAAFERSGGWFELPLAWGSDHVSQMIWAGMQGLRRIDGARVRWRWSGQNISSTRDQRIKMTKVRASMTYVEWLLQRVQEMPDPSFPLPTTVFKPLAREWFLQHLVHQRQFFSPGESWPIVKFLSQTWGGSTLRNAGCLCKINFLAACVQARDAVRRSGGAVGQPPSTP